MKANNVNRRGFLKTAGAAGIVSVLASVNTKTDSILMEEAKADNTALPMRVGIGAISELTEERLAFIQQLGIKDLNMHTPAIPGDKQWEYADLLALRKRIEQAGLRFAAIENVHYGFYDKAMLGLPGRDEQIEHVIVTIRNMGKAGIPILGYNWMPNGVWRSKTKAVLRGGAKATRFDLAEYKNAPLTHGKVYTDEMIWDNYNYYLERILPVAEEANVKLALHPDDPPVESLGGIARIFRSFDGVKKAMSRFDSPCHGLDFCVGTWSPMSPQNVLEAIRYFGKKIFFVHLRFVQGTVPRFNECFINEGSVDPFEVVKTLKEVGFTGFIMDDHVPDMIDDTPFRHRSRAYADGYITAVVEIVNKMEVSSWLTSPKPRRRVVGS